MNIGVGSSGDHYQVKRISAQEPSVLLTAEAVRDSVEVHMNITCSYYSRSYVETQTAIQIYEAESCSF
jgi:hypothetical protein